MGFWDFIKKGSDSLTESYLKDFCGGHPLSHGHKKIGEVIEMIKNDYGADDINNQRINRIRQLVNYMKNQAVSNPTAANELNRIKNDYRYKLEDLGVNI